jgi:hypothetical protein
MRKPGVTESFVMDGVSGANAGGVARAGGRRARAQNYEMTPQVRSLSISAATNF